MAKRLPLRVALCSGGVDRKFFGLFAANDNSFYIHPYRPAGQRWRIPGGDAQRDAMGKVPLDLVNFVEPALEMNKLTLHQSGFIHVTDGHGRRHRDGTRGPAFSEMPLPYDMCLLIPCNPRLLPPRGSERGHLMRIELAPDIRPFYVTLTIIAATAPPAPLPGPLLTQQPINIIFEGMPYGLALTMWPVQTTDAVLEWPSFPFFVVRTAA